MNTGSIIRFAAAPVAAIVFCAWAASAGEKPVPHPHVMWTRDELAAIRRRLETDPLAKKQLEKMELMESGKVEMAGRRIPANPALLNLFKYAVLGDRAAGEREKKALLSFIGARVPEARPGNPATGNAPWRDDRTLDALRYDVLYDELSEEERRGVEQTIRYYINWAIDNPGPWSRGRPRTGWLPNMQWPTMAGVHVLAAALGDENEIRRVFEASGGWKWFFDNYVADGRFYMEEFGKYYSNIGAMILWCEGLRNLGLDRYGWGYEGRGGATMRRFLEMKIALGLPRTDNGPGGMPTYEIVQMGDAGTSPMVRGHDAGGAGGHPWWIRAMMNGPIPKMLEPLWFEAGHRRFPDAGFDYFLARFRAPGEDVYLPSLYFGLGPIDPGKVGPPPVQSYVARERGFALLRAEESPLYWESPAPAVALQFAMYYVHYVHDCFSILNYNAFNRPIYQRMGTVGTGYAGGDPWRDHVRGQASGVVVDGLRAEYVDSGEEGVRNQRVRHHFAPPAKFVAVRARPFEMEVVDKDGARQKVRRAVYPDVDMERALVLTREYLFDLFVLASDRPRTYDWHVMSPAHLAADTAARFVPLDRIEGGALRGRDLGKPHLGDVRVFDAGASPWSATLLLGADGAGDGPRVGVRVSMPGEADTIVLAGRPPGMGQAPGIKLMATRTAPHTVFAALHEPFRGQAADAARRMEIIAREKDAMAVAVTAPDGTSDRILLRWGDQAEERLTLTAGPERFTFSGYGLVRIGKETVEAVGNIASMSVKAGGRPRLTMNGQPAPANCADGMLHTP